MLYIKLIQNIYQIDTKFIFFHLRAYLHMAVGGWTLTVHFPDHLGNLLDFFSQFDSAILACTTLNATILVFKESIKE